MIKKSFEFRLFWCARLVVATILLSLLAASSAYAAGFKFSDTPGDHMDILYKGATVARFMYAFDQSTEEKIHETYKPYLHVFDAAGKAPITKGVGGKYTHHRGIFVGWNKLQFGGEQHDLWHMKGVYQVHQKFLTKDAKADSAVLTSLIHWNGPDGKAILKEERTMTLRSLPAPGIVIVDLKSSLKAVRGDVRLDGDPEHAGAQYRPADEVDKTKTIYAFPIENADPKKDRDYPWVGETYSLAGKNYSVVHMNHSGNPKDTIYSAYRDYGRFGAFFTHDLKDGDTLTINYRFLVAEGELPSVEVIEKYRDDFISGPGTGTFPLDAPGKKAWTVSAASKKKK